MPPKPPLTHFLAIPLSCPQLTASISSFRQDVTSPLSFGIPEDAVRPPGTMHLTIGVMSLKEDDPEGGAESVKKARELFSTINLRQVLKTAKETSNKAGALAGDSGKSEGEEDALRITLKGMGNWGPSSKASVVFAPPVDPQGILYRFCDSLRQTFQDAGVMPVQEFPLVLHATIVNTVYVKGRGGGRGKRQLTVDATDMMARYDDYEWMKDVEVREVTLCKMGAKKVGDEGDEVYDVAAKAEF